MKTTHYTKNAALVAVATLGVALFATGAHADTANGNGDSRMVRYSDVNLSTDAGAKVLLQRIRNAAEQVCETGVRQLERAAATKACVDQAVSTSVRAVDSTQLTRTASAHGYDVQRTVKVASVL